VSQNEDLSPNIAAALDFCCAHSMLHDPPSSTPPPLPPFPLLTPNAMHVFPQEILLPPRFRALSHNAMHVGWEGFRMACHHVSCLTNGQVCHSHLQALNGALARNSRQHVLHCFCDAMQSLNATILDDVLQPFHP
jgi:hypothetical protein